MSKKEAYLPQDTTLSKKPNYVYAIISVALVLFLLGLCGLFVLNARQLITSFKEQVDILIELKPGTEKTAISQLESQLARLKYVKPSSVRFTSKEDAAALLREDFGEDFLKLDFQNPLYDVLTFNLKSAYVDPEKMARVRKQIKEKSIVHDVFYQESMINQIADNVEKVSLFAIVICVFFLLTAMVLIHNTIRLALYANRFLIKNMQLVGASWGFISKPYLWKSVINGMLSGLLACGGLLFLLWFIQRDLPILSEQQNNITNLGLFVSLILLGIFITTISTYYVVHKYLKMRVDDLY